MRGSLSVEVHVVVDLVKKVAHLARDFRATLHSIQFYSVRVREACRRPARLSENRGALQHSWRLQE